MEIVDFLLDIIAHNEYDKIVWLQWEVAAIFPRYLFKETTICAFCYACIPPR